jgi:two-component system, chemotaxis family, CheB/CheR fusion protein
MRLLRVWAEPRSLLGCRGGIDHWGAGVSGNSSRDSGLFIVGVGASAGGVTALERLFRAMPADCGAAFVVVTHIGAHRETLLTEILARHSTMPVVNASHGQRMEPNHVYVLPSDAMLTISQRRLDLRAADIHQRERNPIDIFFASLARAAGENAVGIVLSGAGSDGSLGVKAIKEEGGLTIAQGHDQSGPTHPSMPSSAIATGLVDVVLPVDEIGPKLREFFRTFEVLKAAESASSPDHRPESLSQALQDIHATLRKRLGHDFSRYKHKTLLRRIHRRMQVRKIHSIPEYAERLRQEGDEASLLFRDLLIGVTSFFRDADAFETLAAKVVPKLLEGAGPSDTVRVWVPGCATGEEAYSLAILLREHMSGLSSPPKVQVFATDIDEPALDVARAARYPRAMLEHLSDERLKRFFRAETASCVLNKDVRDMCIFSAHSVIRDPPFSRMDLVSCRNLLIYFNTELQDNVLPVFHYALKSGGYLFLGPAESATRHSDLFSAVDKKHGVFQRRSVMNTNVRIPSWFAIARGHALERATEAALRKDQSLSRQIETRVMENFAPAHIVVETEGDIVYYSARTGKYLEPQSGSPSRQLLAMVRRGLRLELRSALRQAVETQKVVVRDRVEVELEDRVQPIRLTVQPMVEPDQEPLYLVVFTDLGPPTSQEEASQRRPPGGPDEVSSLEQELKETRDRLQTTIEEYETSLEELKSGNEELVSVNEELQSTNEELETSKEELQSVNEELNTVNQELASKVDELHQSNADLRNLFESTQIATVFLDRHMVIRSYTPAVRSIFNLISGDRGRPITDIAHQLKGVDLRADIQKVFDERKPLERSVRRGGGDAYYLMRVLPYRTVDDAIDGVLITFVDVSEVIAAEEQQRMLVAELNHRVRNMLQVVIGLANQTLHRSADLESFDKAFMGRMQALARAYELLSRDGWRKAPIGELIRSQLGAFASEGGRYSTDGDAIELNSSAALALGLVLYELATNATKYGAFSTPGGRVDISWKVRSNGEGGPQLVLHWRESGGPEVRPPEHSGFGSELVNRQLRYELKGEAALEFHTDGLRATLMVPVKDSVIVDR